MKMLYLNNTNGDPVLVNFDNVTQVSPLDDESGTTIYFNSVCWDPVDEEPHYNAVTVVEGLNQIRTMLSFMQSDISPTQQGDEA